MRVLIASSGFKESLSPDKVADAIAKGVKKAIPDAVIYKAPLVDGGEGFTKGLVKATNGTSHALSVTGPLGEPVESHLGFLGGTDTKTAVLDMASAAGLRLVPRDARDPRKTTTYGVGELISAALDKGAQRILIGLGDSGTSDGGAGAVQALGVRLLEKMGNQIEWGGQGLIELENIDLSTRDKRLEIVPIDVACNTHNILCGPEGAAHLFAPQKGASPKVVEELSQAFDNYAEVIEKDLDLDVREIPGGGASGGLGAGLFALLGAKLYPRYEIIMQYLDIDSLLDKVDLVITAEGSLDYQTPRGKIPVEVASRAKKYNLPVIVLAGSIGKDAEINFNYGIDSYMSIIQQPCTLTEAIDNATILLESSSERAMRLILIGVELEV